MSIYINHYTKVFINLMLLIKILLLLQTNILSKYNIVLIINSFTRNSVVIIINMLFTAGYFSYILN